MSDPSTQPPKPLPPDAEEDRTILSRSEPATGTPGHSGDDQDRTILSRPVEPDTGAGDDLEQKEPVLPDADRTVIAPLPDTAAKNAPVAKDEDPDRTILTRGPGSGTADPDPDRTILSTTSPETPSGDASEDAEPDTTQPPQSSVTSDRAPAESGGSTYTPLSDITPRDPSRTPTDPEGQTEATESVFGTRSVAGTLDAVIPPPPGTAPTPLSSLEPGTIINNMYRVEERLDQGGMGRVFRGVEIGTGESVAIKVILPEMAEDMKVAQMFRREARTLRSLHHDAIVRYFAYVPPDQNLNLHALVMGFIEGTKLSDKLKSDGALSRSQVLQLAIRLADGLDRAHSNGIVHRDLSPDNVMLPGGDISKAVLIDFGISRSSRIKDVTIGNEFAGKLKYVSPEQLGDYGGEAEAPSDVYSLGLLMMAMLTGKSAAMGDTIVEAVQKRQTVPDLSEVPAEFHDVLTKMLQPDPQQRLRTMGDVIEELRDLSDGETGLGTRSRMGGRQIAKAAPDRAVPGLQAVPIGKTLTGGAGATEPPGHQPLPAKPEEKRSTGLMVAGLLGLALVAGGAFFALQGGGAGSDGNGAALTPDAAIAQGLERMTDSREAFLATALPEGCAFATLRQKGENAGMIEGYADGGAGLREIGSAFAAQYGAAPDVVDRTIPAAHCAVIDFVRSFQGTRGARIEMALDTHVASRSEGVIGRVHGSNGRQNWLALVDANGRVFSLMRQFDDPIGDERRFAFRLPSAPPGKYLLVATASDATLVRAGAMQDGTGASEIFPLMLRELAQDGQGAVDIAYLELTQ